MALVDPGQSVNSGNNSYQGNWSYGQQPGGNNYPAGIYGVGTGGSGTAVGTVTPDQLTSNQLTGLLNQNSPYIQQARQQAINQANARGAMNSSIAAGNAQGAAIQAALPIAQQDANTYSNLQLSNLDNLSKIQSANIGANAQVQSAAASAGGQIGAAQIGADSALQRQREDLAYEGEQAGLNRSFTQGMTQQQYQNQLGLSNQGYLNQYGLNQQQNMFNYGAQSALSNQGYLQNSALSNQGYGQQYGLAQQGFQNQSALSAQQYQQNLGLGAFNLGGSLLQGQQNFFSNLGIQGLSNPALIGDPSAFGGYAQFIDGLMGNTMDNIFNYALGGGGFTGGR